MSIQKIEDEDDITFERCPHDSANPYTMTSLSLLRDESISPNARWLIMYLLSNKEGWRISRQQVINHLRKHVGRDKTKKIFQECIDAGYMKRIEILVPMTATGEKKVSGKRKSCKYYVSETPKFKKCLHITDDSEAEKKSKKCLLRSEIQTSEIQRSEDTSLSSIKEHKKNQKNKVVVSKDGAAVGCSTPASPKATAPELDKNLALAKDDVFRYAMSYPKDWSSAEIEEAWSSFEKSKSPIVDPLRYIEGIIKKKRLTKDREACKTSTSKNKSTSKKKQDLSMKDESESTREELLEKDTSEPLSQKSKQTAGFSKEFLDSLGLQGIY